MAGKKKGKNIRYVPLYLREGKHYIAIHCEDAGNRHLDIMEVDNLIDVGNSSISKRGRIVYDTISRIETVSASYKPVGSFICNNFLKWEKKT